MKPEVKESLLGPAVVGLVFGCLAGLASFAFDYEYGSSIHPEWGSVWLHAVARAAIVLLVTTGAIVVVFGVTPLIVRWASERKQH